MYVWLRRQAVLMALFTALVLCASRVHAQTVGDARRVEFLPSPDHDAIAEDGAPVVEHYSIEIYVTGARWPVASAELDKPAPDPDGVIRVVFLDDLSAPLVPGVTYEAVIYAIGAAGRSEGARSTAFSVGGVVEPPPPPPPPPPCSYAVAPTSLALGVTKSMSLITVTTQAACAWTATGAPSWIAMKGGGTGSGSVTITVPQNNSKPARSATLTIAGQRVTVTQDGSVRR
jgi:hypothetical protein